jgi:hypothetical protein
VIDVVIAVITANKGANVTNITEPTVETPVAATAEPKAKKGARVRAQRPTGVPKKPKPGKKASPARKAPQAGKKAKGGKPAKRARENSKTSIVLDLLKRPGGVTAKELMDATGWQPHSVRGFLSGTIGKKMGLTLASAKTEDGERTYSIKA